MQDYTPSTSTFSDSISIVESVDAVSDTNANAAAKQLIENDIVLKESIDLLIQNGSKLTDVSGASATTTEGTESVSILWSDPADVIYNGAVIAEWDRTVLVRKAGSAPNDINDGTQILVNNVRDNYASSAFVDTNVSFGTTYYYRFFPISKAGAITKGTALNVTPALEKLTIPTAYGSLTYNGTEQTQSFSNYEPSKMSVSGNTGTNAGSYTATFTLNPGYTWSDGSALPKTVSWSIAKAAGVVTLSTNSVTLDPDHLTATVTVSGATGSLSASSASPSDVSASVSGNTITLTAESEDSKTVNVTVNVAASSNYNATSATIAVELSFIGELDDATWAQISAVSAAGTASGYWSVGDCKKITLNGTVGTLSLSNKDLYVFILGIDHNSATEGSGISFGCFKTAKTGGTDVCLCDDTYGSSGGNTGNKKFALNHWGSTSGNYNTNFGGWKGCDARYDILGSTKQAPSGYGSTPQTNRVGYDAASDTATSPVSNTLMAALPSDLRNVMKPITKYTDNKGNSSNTSANVTSSVDYLPLLSEYEVQGARTYANEYEKNSQAQYAYYANGNSKVKYQHGSTSSAAYWWCRSAASSNAATFCLVTTDGSAYGTNSRYSYGLAPVFLV